jgi:fucose 4-O-acetylase-like acetyltransferase
VAVVQPGKRDLLVDAMKGFGIILVILGHTLQGSSAAFDESFAFRLIYSFHMPLFFFISGYVLQFGLKGKPLAPISFVLKKARALVLPFLSWYFLFGLWKGIPAGITLSEYAQRLVLSPAYGYWFLWVLFLCFVAFLPLAWLQQRIDAKWHAGLIAPALLTFYYLRELNTGIYGLGLLRIHYFYFAVGFFLCYWRAQLSALSKNCGPEFVSSAFCYWSPIGDEWAKCPFSHF